MLNRLTRRKLFATTSSGVVAASVPGSGVRAADPWPTKPIRVLMPFGVSGQLRGLALSHSERMKEFPDLPTFAEVGYPNVRASNDFGVAIRAGTPSPIRARLEEAYRTAVRRPEIVQRLADVGLIVVGTSSAEFTRALADDTARYTEVIRVANIKLE